MLHDNIARNRLPTPAEVVTIREVITAQEEQIVAMDQRIEQLRERVGALIVRKELLGTEVNAQRAFISPIRRLLPEILQEIFIYCLPVTYNAVMTNREAPLLLGHVCSYWRRLAFATPGLWASIHIVTPPQSPYLRKPPPLREISAWLSRSGALPLSISLSSPYSLTSPTDSLESSHFRYLDIISPFKSRWKSIYIYISNLNWANYFFERFRAADVPLLEKIHLQNARVLDATPLFNGPSFDLTLLTKEDSILRAPRLRSLSILPCGSDVLQLPIKWENITRLNLSWNIFHYQEVVRALRLCPNLEACVIASSDPKSFDAAEVLELTLPKLLSLTVIDECETESDLSRLLKGLHAPNLRHFTYDRRPHWPPPEHGAYSLDDTLNALPLFFANLIHPLEELELHTDSIFRDDVMKILNMVPALKRLSLRGTGRPMGVPPPPLQYDRFLPLFLFGNAELKQLTPGKGGFRLPPTGLLTTPSTSTDDGDDDGPPSDRHRDCLCPRLEVFHCTGSMFSDATMLDFLQARSLHYKTFNITQLKKASISFVSGKEQSSDTQSQLDMLKRDAGLGLSIVYSKAKKARHRPRRYAYSPYDGLNSLYGGAPDFQYGKPAYFGF